MQGHGCWKSSSQWEKVAKCNLRVKLKYMKDVLSHEMKWLFAMQEDRFSCVRAFLQSKSC